LGRQAAEEELEGRVMEHIAKFDEPLYLFLHLFRVEFLPVGRE
jgi:hypothetical protein